MLLDKQIFQIIIENTPLVSIDLLIQDSKGRVLLGKRKNPPAQNFWFVPGGRIRKNETHTDAFRRLTIQELGREFLLSQAKFVSPYQHFYADSAFDKDISTHYVVLAYQLLVSEDLFNLPLEQHSRYRWFTIDDLLNDEQVHQYTKDYFV